MNLVDRALCDTVKTTRDGQHLFFPRGRLGRGYVVSAQQRKEIRDFIRNQLIAAAVVALATALIQPFWPSPELSLILGLPLIAYCIHRVRRFTAGLHPTNESLSPSDFHLDSSLSFHAAFLVGKQEVHKIALSQAWSSFAFFERYQIDGREELRFEGARSPASRRFTIGTREMHEVEIRRNELPWSMQVYVDGELFIKELFPKLRKLSIACIVFVAVVTLGVLWPLILWCVFVEGLR